MRGLLFNLIEEVVDAAFPPGSWDELLDRAGLDGAFTSLGTYPDEAMEALVLAAVDVTGSDRATVLRLLGRAVFSPLAGRYPELLDGHRSVRTFLPAVEHIIHPEIRKLDPRASVPTLEAKVEGDVEGDGDLELRYASPRHLCHLAEGLVLGAADHFGEVALVEQPTCELRGDPECHLQVQLGLGVDLPPDLAPPTGTDATDDGDSAEGRAITAFGPTADDPAPDDERAEARFRRERKARLEAEAIAERATRALFLQNRDLEGRVQSRTAQIEEARAQAVAANRAKTAFLGVVGHELRTPLNELLGALALIDLDRPAAENEADLRTATEGAQRLAASLDALFLHVDLESGRATASRASCDPREVLDEAVTRWRRGAARRGLLLVDDLDPALPARAALDRERLDRILDELLGNAVEFGERGTIGLRTEVVQGDDGPRLVVEITDQGPGMAADDAARAFEPFVQLDGGASRRHGGLGLGLAIVAGLARTLGATIELLPAEPRGTTARLDLPLS